MEPEELRHLSRDTLIERASSLGIDRPKAMTRVELVDEILRRSEGGRRRRGWFGRARDLVATVVERGLHLPETATLLRPSPSRRAPSPPPPLPTVTLAEIYAAQGYHEKAVTVLDEVLRRQPEHVEAQRLRERLVAAAGEGEGTAAPSRESRRATGSTQDEGRVGSFQDAASRSTDTESVEAEAMGSDSAAADRPRDEPPGGDGAQGGGPATGYDVDDVVALATDPETAFVYWEVRPISFARVSRRRPEGRLVVRVLATRPSERGEVSTSTRDVPVDELVGDVFLRGLPPGGEVRIAIGWKAAGELSPLAVAPELRMPRRFATPRPGLAPAPEPSAAPAPGDEPAVMPAGYQRLLDRAPPITWADLGGPASAEDDVTRRPWTAGGWAAEREEIERLQRWFGGASDLYLVAEERRRLLRLAGEHGGASDLAYGGASDLAYGGASDLDLSYGGASDSA